MNILVVIISLCVLYSFALCYTTGLLSTAGKKVKDFNGQHCRPFFIPATHPKMLLFIDKMKTSCNNIHMKMNISFTFSSRYIMTAKLQSFSQTTFNCFAECCNEKCFVQDECHCELFDHCASRHSTYIYMEKTFFQGVFSTILLSLLCF